MTLNEFLDYMKENLQGYQNFYDKALEYQEKKNKARQANKRWKEVKIGRAINEMWKNAMKTLYEKLKSQVDKKIFNNSDSLIKYINDNEILDMVNEQLSEVEFE